MLVQIPLSALREGIQIRYAEDQEKIIEYSEILKECNHWIFPRLQVVSINGEYCIADGHHRLKAAQNANWKEDIPCEVIEGTNETLLEKAFEMNAPQGVHMTEKDWKHALEIVIREYPEKSSRALAEFCHCSRSKIDRLKKELEAEGKYQRPETVIGKDGVAQKVKHTKILGGSNAPPREAQPPEARAGFVTCAQCGTEQLKEMTEQRDTTWRQIGLDDSGKYRWLCSDECESEWNKEQEARLESELENEQTGTGGNLRIFEGKPPKEPDSIVLEIGLACSVQGTTDPKEALETIKEELPLALVGSRFKIRKASIININLNEYINIINTGKSKEGKTDFCFHLKDKGVYYLPVALYEEWGNRYPTIDLDSSLTDCMNYYNRAEGSEKPSYNTLKQRIESWLMRKRDEAKRNDGRSKSSKQNYSFSEENYE